MHEPRPARELWRVRVSDGWATAELWAHPIGWELRVLWEGNLQRSQAYRDVAEAQRDPDATKARLEDYNRERLRLPESTAADALPPLKVPPRPPAQRAESVPRTIDIGRRRVAEEMARQAAERAQTSPTLPAVTCYVVIGTYDGQEWRVRGFHT